MTRRTNWTMPGSDTCIISIPDHASTRTSWFGITRPCSEELRDCIDHDVLTRSLSLLGNPSAGIPEGSSFDTQGYVHEDGSAARSGSAESSTPEPLHLDFEHRTGVGSLLDDYELLERIARGGMGIIYRARQRSLNRIVAVKVIADAEFANESAIERFQSEAQAAAV